VRQPSALAFSAFPPSFAAPASAVTNVARHSNATEALLALSRNGDSVVLQIADNGHGFKRPLREGGGLRGIRENALIVDAALAIKPSPMGGVEVRLEVPTKTG
jgi:two-component system sensor histidine kinase UhpB